MIRLAPGRKLSKMLAFLLLLRLAVHGKLSLHLHMNKDDLNHYFGTEDHARVNGDYELVPIKKLHSSPSAGGGINKRSYNASTGRQVLTIFGR